MMQESENETRKDLHYSIEMESFDDADEMFVVAKDRLLDINNWHKIAEVFGGICTLIDHHGRELQRKAHWHDYIKIKTESGQNDKWLYIDTVEYHDYPDDNLEGMTMSLSSAMPPLDAN